MLDIGRTLPLAGHTARHAMPAIYDLIRAALAQHILHGAGEAPEVPIATLNEFVWKGIGSK